MDNINVTVKDAYSKPSVVKGLLRAVKAAHHQGAQTHTSFNQHGDFSVRIQER